MNLHVCWSVRRTSISSWSEPSQQTEKQNKIKVDQRWPITITDIKSQIIWSKHIKITEKDQNLRHASVERLRHKKKNTLLYLSLRRVQPWRERWRFSTVEERRRATERDAVILPRGEMTKERRSGGGELERRVVVDQIGHNRWVHQQIRGFHWDKGRRLQPISEKSINTGGFDEERWRDAVSSTRRRERRRVIL